MSRPPLGSPGNPRKWGHGKGLESRRAYYKRRMKKFETVPAPKTPVQDCNCQVYDTPYGLAIVPKNPTRKDLREARARAKNRSNEVERQIRQSKARKVDKEVLLLRKVAKFNWGKKLPAKSARRRAAALQALEAYQRKGANARKSNQTAGQGRKAGEHADVVGTGNASLIQR